MARRTFTVQIEVSEDRKFMEDQVAADFIAYAENFGRYGVYVTARETRAAPRKRKGTR